MFIISVKTTRKKLFLILGVGLFVLILLGVIISGLGTEADTFTVGGREYSRKAKDNEERRTFLTQLGWTCGEEPVEVMDIRVPEAFNDVYEQYNELQKSQGFDLEKYAGKRVKRYTYEITNYPGETEGVRANLLVADGVVIGGDISSVALDGFMHGLGEGAPAQTSSDTGSVTDAQAGLPIQSGAGDGASSAVTSAEQPAGTIQVATDESDAEPAEPTGTGVGEGVQDTAGQPAETEGIEAGTSGLNSLK